jgi:hypothetical protein
MAAPSDDVVAAGVTDVGQRVELGAEHDVQVTAAHGGPKGGGQIGDTTLDAKARVFGQQGHGARTFELDVSEFGMRVHEVTESDQLVPVALDGAGGNLSSAHSTTTTVSPALTESPAVTLIDTTTPDFSALTEFSIFIASRITTVSPASTC